MDNKCSFLSCVQLFIITNNTGNREPHTPEMMYLFESVEIKKVNS